MVRILGRTEIENTAVRPTGTKERSIFPAGPTVGISKACGSCHGRRSDITRAGRRIRTGIGFPTRITTRAVNEIVLVTPWCPDRGFTRYGVGGTPDPRASVRGGVSARWPGTGPWRLRGVGAA